MKTPDILFLIPPFHRRNGSGSFSPLGTGYLISSVEANNYTWDIINCSEFNRSFFHEDLVRFRHSLEEKLSTYKPLIIGIGPCITTQLRALDVLVDVCKTSCPNSILLAGGPLASIEGQEWFFYEKLGISSIIKGDGELAVPDAIRVVKQCGNIQASKYVSHDGYSYINCITNVNDIPFPHRFFQASDTFSTRRRSNTGRTATMITSRGCPYSCYYCVSGNMKKSRIYQKRSNENIILEMKYLQDHGISDIIFYDDCFFAKPNTVNDDILAFSNCLSAHNVTTSWQMEMRPDVFCNLTPSSIRTLSSCNCRQINLGIEKITKHGLTFLGKKGSWPNLKECIKSFKSVSNISLAATFILGGESESYEQILDDISVIKNLGLDFAHFNPLFVYPGTPLYSYIFPDSRSWADFIMHDDLPWGEIVYETDSLSREKLLELVNLAYLEFYKGTPHEEELMVKDRFNLRRI